MQFFDFLKYNNAVPIAFSILAMGGASAYAATNPEAIYAAQQRVVSIDNTYLVNKDLTTFAPTILITGVTEDAENYYVAYTVLTIDLQDAVWQDVISAQVMTVSKEALGEYRDLGVFVTEQLKNVVSHERERLVQTQEFERRNISQKVVATTYSGLVGKMLDERVETLPGYTPVRIEDISDPDYVAPQVNIPIIPVDGGQVVETTPPSSMDPSLTLQILGNNPAEIPLRTHYVDLGAVATNAANENISLRTYMNGKEVIAVQIDTSVTGQWTVRYEATDPRGNTVSKERIVSVYDPAAAPSPVTPMPPVEEIPVETPPTEQPTDQVPEPDPLPQLSPSATTTSDTTPPPVDPAATSTVETEPASTTPVVSETPTSSGEGTPTEPAPAATTTEQ